MKNIYREFKDKICPYCTNKDTNLCEIHTMIDGGLKCPYYNKDITKFKRKVENNYETSLG